MSESQSKSLLQRVDHVGIAVEDLEQAVTVYTALVGEGPRHYETVESQKVKTAFFHVGESHLELLQATAPDSPIAKFITKNGRGGIHHICVAVDDIHAKLTELKAAGVQLIHPEPIEGAQNKLVAFIHPKSMNGVLIELSQDKTS